MTTIDARGEQVNFNANASVGIYTNLTAKPDSEAVYDLTGKTVVTVLKDFLKSPYSTSSISETSISQSITDAVNGLYDFEISPALLINKEGEELSHETYALLSDGSRIGIAWGVISVSEIV